MLDLGLLLFKSQFLPLGLSYVTMPGIFLNLLMVFQGPGRIVHALVSSWILYFLIFNDAHKLILQILGSNFLCDTLLLKLASFRGQYLVFQASYSCTNLVTLPLHCLIYLLRLTAAALWADSSLTNPWPPIFPLMQSINVCLWVVDSFNSLKLSHFFNLSFQFLL